ncbi:MAG TPA: leucine-rich repeat domain-containing protein [Candidatus Paceibacterota bacterium]|nr:leucine-rich repeat domain-containing protein [Verrucomicrobiota bacterium]HRY48970.1 leucine-rich repeat domain-containing protein [Candidatus Paceibacterota bacterium]HRZ99747.1 leucine-rich repeat domain-containing protein [Candidatus Paceibacterota bacterium]
MMVEGFIPPWTHPVTGCRIAGHHAAWLWIVVLFSGFDVGIVNGQHLIPGALKREMYANKPGEGQIAVMVCDPRFPSSPDLVDTISAMETPSNIMDFYSQRIWGFLIPKKTADYLFYISTDDQGMLFLSSDQNPANKTLIAYEPYWSSARDWTNPRNPPGANVSFPIHLEGGKPYYIEALMREFLGGDSFSVAWREAFESGIAQGPQAIQGESLAWTEASVESLEQGPPVIHRLMPSEAGVEATGYSILVNQQAQFTLWAGAYLNIGCLASGSGPLEYQWFYGGQPIPNATNRTWTISALEVRHSGVYWVEVRNLEGLARSEPTVVKVRTAEPMAGPILNPANNRFYYLLGRSSWPAAEAAAVQLNGHLATVRDSAMHSWLYGIFGHYGGVNRDLWIGFYDSNPLVNSPDIAARKMEFNWISGEPKSFSNWAPNEPNSPDIEDYVYICRPASAGGFPGRWSNNYLGYDQACGVVEVAQEEIGSLKVTGFNAVNGEAEITWIPPLAKVIVEEFSQWSADPLFRASTAGQVTNRLSFVLPSQEAAFYRLRRNLQAANVVDPVLYLEVLKQVKNKVSPTNQLYDQDLLPITALEIASKTIQSLAGLEHARLLETLRANQNVIIDISPLSGLAQLSILDLSGNLIQDPSPLADDISLKELFLGNNSIQDPASLANLRGLITLHLQDNEITDANALTNLTNLRSLNVGNNLLMDISFVRPLAALSWASFYGNTLADLSPLANHRTLEYLDLNNCADISDLGPLANLATLTGLHMANNRISDILPLAGLRRLSRLNLDGNRLLDIGPLTELTNMVWLVLNNNRILDISPLRDMTELADGLGLANNRLANLQPLSRMSKLRSLDINGNALVDISTLSNLVSLAWLAAPNNRVGNVAPLAGLVRLDYLDLNNNSITSITSLGRLVNLRGLHLSGNQIQDIQACTNLVKLNELNLSNNRLTEISALLTNAVLGGLGAGDNVYLGGNPLTAQGKNQIEQLRQMGVNVSY